MRALRALFVLVMVAIYAVTLSALVLEQILGTTNGKDPHPWIYFRFAYLSFRVGSTEWLDKDIQLSEMTARSSYLRSFWQLPDGYDWCPVPVVQYEGNAICHVVDLLHVFCTAVS